MNVGPRIPHLEPPYDADVAAGLARMQPRESKVDALKLFRTFAHNMPLSRAFGPLGGYMLGRTSGASAGFDDRTRELVIDRVTARCGCEYEWGVHIAAYGRHVGLTDLQIASLVNGSGADACWSDDDRTILDMVDQLHDTGQIGDETWQRLEARFSKDIILELLILAGWYHAIAYVANGARTELEAWGARFPKKD
jgi:alkylhydroperoxidase family enzyme